MQTESKQPKNKKVLFVILLLLLIIGISYAVLLKLPRKSESVLCTQEAKLCPDGSYVGRTGPKCEFAQCPDSANNDLWKLGTDSQTGISFKYPEKLLTDYIFTQSWPPKVAVSNNDQQLNCLETSAESSLPQRVAKRMVDNRTYCVKANSEGAVGSVYTTYDYSTIRDDKLVTVSFTLVYPQCDNYDDPQKTTCKDERTSFDLDSTVDRIVQTIKLGSK